MNLSGPFIRRPVMTTLVMAAILVFGVMSYRLLPINNLPAVDFPTIQVSASLSGASPETMATAVATPLEKQFSTISGLDTMTSSSAQGLTQVTLQFALDRDIDNAAQDVQAAIAKTLPQLPQGILPPSYQKTNPADQPIQYFALTSKTLPLYMLDEYGQTLLAQRISMVSGVAQVSVFGSQKYAVRVQLDPRALASRGIGIDEVAAAIRSGNVSLPTGTLWGPDRAVTLEASGQLASAAEFRPLVVAYRNGAPVRLGDLGRVTDDVQNNKVAAWFVDTRAIILAVQRQPGTNTVAVAAAVRDLVDTLRKQLPGAVDLKVLYDRSESIRDSVHDVKVTLLVTLVLVVLVIFLFLRNLPATVIPSLALPLSVVGTFAAMYLLGYSLDNLSLMALTLAVGFVVDDAIVMLENIVRHREMGKPPLAAALDGSREVGFTILSMTLSLVSVFIPLLIMGGIIGRLFHEFAVTLGLAILVSGFVSLTLSPMMCSRFLRAPESVHHGRAYQVSERVFDRTLAFYVRTLAWTVGHRKSTLAFSAAILVGTVLLARAVPKGFLPSEDIGMLFGVTEAAEGTSFESMKARQKQVAAILAADPSIEGFMSSVGAGGPTSVGNQGRLFVKLKPRDERELDADRVIAGLRPKLARVVGMRVFLQNPPSIRIGGRITKSMYQFTLQGTDGDELYAAAPRLEARLREIPGLTDVTSDLLLRNPQVHLAIDRDRASALGVNAEQIETALYTAYGDRQVSTIYTATNQYWVALGLLPEDQRDARALSLLYVRSASGKLVPLDAVTTRDDAVGPLTVNHSGQIPAVTLSFDLAPGASLSKATTEVEAAARETLPETITTAFAGTAQAFQSSQSGLGILLILAVLVVYLVLGILYESFIHPLTILTGLPFAGFGALLTLWIFRTDLNLYSFVGIILLIGVVKKNAIMMIDFAQEQQRVHGKPAREAILEACRIRFRPIMMTTMAAFMGTLPIALGFGAGAEARRPLGLAVVGGLAFSQIVTLYVTPVFYTYMDGFQVRLARRIRRGHVVPGT
jgi:HAE1 family hydrophobic/amphiphilic exporter-1